MYTVPLNAPFVVNCTPNEDRHADHRRCANEGIESGGSAQYRPLPRRFHVSVERYGIRKMEVTDCDFQYARHYPMQDHCRMRRGDVRPLMLRRNCVIKILIGLLAGVLIALPVASAESCATLEVCLAKFPSVASDDPGISPEQNALAEAVQRFGPSAIPSLLQLLESRQKGVSTLAGYTLRDIEGLGPEHLPPLMKARRNGDGWIPPAIARIGTPEAIDFLLNDLRKDPETNTQVTWALEKLGSKAAPGLANLLRCTETCDESVFGAAIFVFSEMKEKAASAVPALLQIAGDDKFTPSSRRSAISAIGEIGKSAQPDVPQLIALKKRVPMLKSTVDSALANIGVAEAVSALLETLAADPQSALRRIAKLGSNGSAAGPAVIGYLGDQRWDVRVAAADTLGRIAYAPAEPDLRSALTDLDDWRLVYSAVLALAHLKANGSIEALKQVRDSHWYPPVRNVAASAMNHIESGTPVAESEWWHFAAVNGAPPSCSRVTAKAIMETKERKMYSKDHLFEMARLAYESAKRTYTPSELANSHKGGQTNDEANSSEPVDRKRQIPSVALKVPDGWLAGTDHGEWGGQLIHMPADGPSEVLFEENIQDIFLLGNQLVAISGLAHLGMNNGMLLRIEKNRSGHYAAIPWKRLPAAPDTSWLVEGGGLLVNTQKGGSVMVDAAGRIRMAKCL
jgi:HEAT repeat protein